MSEKRWLCSFHWLREQFTAKRKTKLRSERLALELLEERTLLSTLVVGTAQASNSALLASWLSQQAPMPTDVKSTQVQGVFEVDTSDAQAAALTSVLKANPSVAYVEPLSTIQIQLEPNDPQYTNGSLYGMNGTDGIQANKAWDVSTGSTAVTVAVIDTGIDYRHPDLYENIWINQAEIPPSVKAAIKSNPSWDVDGDGLITFYDLNDLRNQGPGKITDLDGDGRITAADILMPASQGGWSDGIDQDGDGFTDDLIGWNFINNTNNPFDDNRHGTHVSGTIGAMGNNGVGVVGVNWKVQIMALKFLDASGSGDDVAGAAAVEFAANHGAQVANASWGDTVDSTTLDNAISDAATKNMLFVAAAGNSSQNTDVNPQYPSVVNLPNIVAVAASTSTGTLASFSNYGPTTVDLAAPGLSILSTIPNNSYGVLSGTSMATPHVAGAAALIVAHYPGISYADLKTRLLGNVTHPAGLAGTSVTGGLLDVFDAIKDGPEIKVLDGANSLFDGTSTISFGSKSQGNPANKVLTVTNIGNQTLLLNGPISVSAGFSVVSSFGTTSLAPGASTTFTISMATASPGSFSGTLSFGDNDANENPFNLLLSGVVTPLKYDFGTATSPVAAGFVGVTQATTYSAARGYGWQSATMLSIDRAVGTDLTRDFNYGADGTFLVDVPNGVFTITLTLGDTGAFAHDQMGIFAEGVQLDSVSTTAGQVVTKNYSVLVSDGQLTLHLHDLGGTDPNVVIEGLQVAADINGPSVALSAPTGNAPGPHDRFTLNFSEPIQDGTFTLADVVSLTGPNGAIAPLAVNKLSSTQYEVTFASQTALGTYAMTIGPNILDLAGNPMNQDGDAINGEIPDDQYSASFTITTFQTERFDFGTASSPVAAGYSQMTDATLYNAARGFGWQAATMLSTDRGTGSDLTRDLNYGADGTFLADLPNGSYDLTLTLGDTGPYAHDLMGINAEGVQLDSVTTTTGQVVSKTYTVSVADGQLTLNLHDLGGSDPFVVIEGLQIAASAPDTAGPTVSTSTPSGSVTGPRDRITFTFSEPIQAGTFTLADVVSLIGPNGAITPLAVNTLSSTQFEVTFASQSTVGIYSMIIGPNILDLAGNPMNQDGDGTNGEIPDDRYTASFTLVTTLPFQTERFDFGTASSPVAAGYTQVTEATTYTATRTFGWQSATMLSLDRGIGTDLTRDLNYGADGTFLADVPNGSYDLTLTLGDTGPYAHDLMGINAEGVQLDSVSTTAGQVVTKTYTVVVADGQLTLHLHDLGGSDPFVVIEGLQIAASAPDTAGPTVTASTPTGSVIGPRDRITFTFSEPIQASTFTLADVVSLIGPNGAIAPLAVNTLSSTQFEVTFASQSTLGTYSMIIGPNILDLAGNPMNQDGDGTNGEIPDDRYTASFTLVTTLPFQTERFDFGTASSPVAAGYTQVTEATTYTATRTFGWQSVTMLSLDRGIGADLTRDFNYGADGTFLADVPNGVYILAITLGDAGPFAHDQVGVIAEGVQLDSVTTAAGQVVTNTYSVAVTDGQLTLRLHDLGGSDPNVVIEALQISLDAGGPSVLASTPTGTVSGTRDRIAYTFSKPIQDGTFTLADVVALTGPSGALTPLAVNKLSSTQYEVTFAPQTALGSYSMTIGPNILDLAGNPMNQDGDGTNGEIPDDRYTATFTLAPFQTEQFDFGTATSPVAAGYTQVTDTTTYSAARGFGWQSATMLSLDRGNGSDLNRDFNDGADGTFLAALPNGTYNITLTLGDTGPFQHDQMGVFAEGVQLDSVSTAAGQVVARTYTVTISDGQLTLRLVDLGGSDPNVVVEGLVISASS